MAAYAELEGEVLGALTERAIAAVAATAEASGLAVGRVLDVGSGPGVGTALLAQQFPAATVTAADGSTAMLERAAERAARLGCGERVTTRRLELPDGLAGAEAVDVLWASLVLHHVGDEPAALRRFQATLTPGGLLGLVERPGHVRFLPDTADLGRPGLWDRLDAARAMWFERMRMELPGARPSEDYLAMLVDAGFEVVHDEELSLEVAPPAGEPARRLAREHVGRMQAMLTPHADPADLAALGVLLDDDHPDSLQHRPDVGIRTTRHLYIARRPS
jgi:SAM-dependent methyltransferase